MTIEIRLNDNGRHDVVKYEPMVLGTFPDRAHAELFATALGPDSNKPPAFLEPAASPPPAAPAPAPAKTDSLPPAPSAKLTDGLKRPEMDDAIWNKAMDRLEAGEGCKSVAEDMQLPFGKLRGRWAANVANGSRIKPETVATAAKMPVKRETVNSPTSGGVGAVLARGRNGSSWTDDEDMALIELDGAGLLEFARDTGRSVVECDRRQNALREQTQRLMNEEPAK